MDAKTLMLPETMNHFRMLINKLLIEKGITAKDIAQQANMSYGSIRFFLNETSPIGPRTMVKLGHWIIKQGYKIDDLNPNK